MRRDLSQLIDAGVVAVVGAIAVAGAAARAQSSHRGYAVTLAVAATTTLLARRRAPVLALAASAALVVGLFALDRGAATLAVVVPAAALYSLALVRGRGHIIVGVFVAAGAVVVADVFLAGGHPRTLTLQTVSHAALVAIPVLAGEALRNHRANVRLLVERAELAERTREEEAQRRAEQARLRIARDLHDVVAHTLTTINVQAGVARHLLEREPRHAEGALATIETASHDALQELRAILGVLRDPSGGAAPLEPAPGLDAIPALIEQARAGDAAITFDAQGQRPVHISDAVELAAYRILQESLTNWRRHASGAPVQVTISYDRDRLRLQIENEIVDGANGNDVRQGTGIVGMRERAASLGGTVQAARADGCFHVAAELPYSPAA